MCVRVCVRAHMHERVCEKERDRESFGKFLISFEYHLNQMGKFCLFPWEE